ncbi:hypothetical protein HD806DRAFT_520266 [Xylariaceae sp. AK1471]|nr:hypothetical protein HD806DRAFT_520266 [Xylariaceae sp. AK1471]
MCEVKSTSPGEAGIIVGILEASWRARRGISQSARGEDTGTRLLPGSVTPPNQQTAVVHCPLSEREIVHGLCILLHWKRLFSDGEHSSKIPNAPGIIRDILHDISVPHSFEGIFKSGPLGTWDVFEPVSLAIGNLKVNGLNDGQWAFITVVTPSFELLFRQHEGRIPDFRHPDYVLLVIDRHHKAQRLFDVARRWAPFARNLACDEWLIEPMMSIIDENTVLAIVSPDRLFYGCHQYLNRRLAPMKRDF